MLEKIGTSTPMMFENQVRQIVINFLKYLEQSYRKLFSETVLMHLNTRNSLGEIEYDQSCLTQADFEKTIGAMSQSRFTLDVSFLALLINAAKERDEGAVVKDIL